MSLSPLGVPILIPSLTISTLVKIQPPVTHGRGFTSLILV
jgi:hypothetical protein